MTREKAYFLWRQQNKNSSSYEFAHARDSCIAEVTPISFPRGCIPFWSAPRMQDLWDNQCQNANESKSDWLLKFTGSLRVRSFKTGNENFAGRFSITSETDSGKEIRKWAIQTPKESINAVKLTFMLDKDVKREQVSVAWSKRKRRQNPVIRCSWVLDKAEWIPASR